MNFENTLVADYTRRINIITQIIRVVAILLVSVTFWSCSRPVKYKQILSYPERQSYGIKSSQSRKKKITILFTGNLHGQTAPVTEHLSLNNKNHSQQISVGGLEVLKSYLEIFRKQNGDNHILLDIGYIFGSDLNTSNKNSIMASYDSLKYDAIGLSGQELVDFFMKKDSRNKLYQNMKTPLLSTNTFDLRTGKSLEKKPIFPYKIVERDGIKLAILSMSSISTIPGEKRKSLSGVYFEDPIVSFLKTKHLLRKKKVNAIILISHVSSHCQPRTIFHQIKGKDHSKHQLSCMEGHSGLAKLIKRLPPNAVDLIISGDNQFAFGYVGDMPVAQIKGKGKFLGLIDFYFNSKSKDLLSKKTTLNPPVKLCHRFFTSTNDCHLEIENNDIRKKRLKVIKNTAFQTIPAKFLGHEITVSEHITK